MKPFNLQDIEARAREMVDTAREKAHAILAAAAREAESMRAGAHAKGHEAGLAAGTEAGHAEGYRDGFEKGRREGHAEACEEARDHLDAVQGILTTLTEQWDAAYRKLYADAEENVLRLALATARKVIAAEQILHPDAVLRSVNKAVSLCAEARCITVQIHPDDLERCRAFAPTLAESFQKIDTIAWRADATLSPGDVRVLTELGEVNAAVAVQMRAIEAALLGEPSLPDEPVPQPIEPADPRAKADDTPRAKADTPDHPLAPEQDP